MLRNFFTTLHRFALSSSLNIIGLSVAFAAAIVILIEVDYQLSFDRGVADVDRIYRVSCRWNEMDLVPVAPGVVKYVESNCPSVEASVAIQPAFGDSYITVTRNGAQVGFTEPVWGATDSFDQVFSLQAIEGTLELETLEQIILPRSVAQRYFGRTTNVVGEKISVSYTGKVNDYVVCGVFEDLTENCQINNAPYVKTDFYAFGGSEWNEANFFLYAKLPEGSTFKSLEADLSKLQLQALIEKLYVIPFTDIYFDQKSYFGDDMLVKKGNRTTTDVLLAIAFLVILIAGINFVNFATSLAPIRMRSINTQKVFGCPTARLRLQLVVEAIGISVVAFCAALLWVYFLGISPLADLSSGVIAVESNLAIVAIMAGVAVIVGLLAGLYPAYYTTKFPPALVLKGSFANSAKGRTLRLVLVCVQFVISITLIIATLFLQRQNDYLQKKDTGIATEHIAVVRLGGKLLDNSSAAFTEQLRAKTSIVDVAYSRFSIGRDNMIMFTMRKISGEQRKFGELIVSHNFADVMGIKIIEGQSTSVGDTSKELLYSMIFNQTAAKQFGIQAPQQINDWGDVNSEVVGICSDFNFQTLRNGVEPLALAVPCVKANQSNDLWNKMPVAYVKFSGDPAVAIQSIKTTAAAIDPVYPISVSFYGEMFEQMYKNDIKTTQMVTLFSILAVLISLVGVFGMVVFETQYRRREIGVRRVHGASVSSILLMFNRRFVYIVLCCSIVAVPLAAWGVGAWLDGFAYRTSLSWWVFVVGVVIVFLITIATVTLQSWHAATENPVRSLKSN